MADLYIKFTPESGNLLIADVENKVYFQGLADLLGSDVAEFSSADLITVNLQTYEEKTLISGIKPINLGRGYFRFIPERDTTYMLRVNWNEAYASKRYLLPTVDPIRDLNLIFNQTVFDQSLDSELQFTILANERALHPDHYQTYNVSVYHKDKAIWW